MVDWNRIQELLLQDSERLILALFAEHKKQKDPLAAIGYVYEFGRGQLCFDLCANTVGKAKTMRAEDRWNSGDYDLPGGGGDWSEALWDEMNQLDDQAKDLKSQEHVDIHENVARICCSVLAELARRGVLGDWSALDFNVAALLDELPDVKRRDSQIKKLIKSNAKPKG